MGTVMTVVENDMQESRFLQLPAEIRLHIYSFFQLPLKSSHTFTLAGPQQDISSTPDSSDLPNSLTPCRKIAGFPTGHVPVLVRGVEHDLFSSARSSCREFHNIWDDLETVRALRCTSSQIRRELSDVGHEDDRSGDDSAAKSTPQQQLDLVLVYPFGVCLAAHGSFRHLLAQTRSVRIVGVCDLGPRAANQDETHMELSEVWAKALDTVVTAVLGPEAVSRNRASLQVGSSEPQATSGAQEEADDDDDDDDEDMSSQSSASLSAASFDDEDDGQFQRAIASGPAHAVAGAAPITPTITTPARRPLPVGLLEGPSYLLEGTSAPAKPSPPALHLRVFHPDNYGFSYHGIWSAKASPGPRALAAICGGAIRLAVFRGTRGTGMEIVARDNGGKGRMLSALWPRFAPGEDDGLGWNWAVGAIGDWENASVG